MSKMSLPRAAPGLLPLSPDEGISQRCDKDAMTDTDPISSGQKRNNYKEEDAEDNKKRKKKNKKDEEGFADTESDEDGKGRSRQRAPSGSPRRMTMSRSATPLCPPDRATRRAAGKSKTDQKQVEVAFASWELGLIQACLAKASAMKEAIGDPRLTNMKTMMNMLADVPEDVLLAAGRRTFKEVEELTKLRDKVHVEMVLNSIVELCEQAKAFYKDHHKALGGEPGAVARGACGATATPDEEHAA